jgi:hypothetical protein
MNYLCSDLTILKQASPLNPIKKGNITGCYGNKKHELSFFGNISNGVAAQRHGLHGPFNTKNK